MSLRILFRFSCVIMVGGFTVACQLTDRAEKKVTSDVVVNQNSASNTGTNGKIPAFKFEQTGFDFGQIAQGEKVIHVFNFENAGEADLVIASVEGSCGCTVSRNWPKHPIQPGEKGEIEIVFDSERKQGKQQKTVSIVANTSPATTVLTIDGEVMVPDNLKGN